MSYGHRLCACARFGVRAFGKTTVVMIVKVDECLPITVMPLSKSNIHDSQFESYAFCITLHVVRYCFVQKIKYPNRCSSKLFLGAVYGKSTPFDRNGQYFFKSDVFFPLSEVIVDKVQPDV